MQNINRQMNKNLDPRGIMIVEDPIEVKAMGWRYGDVISVSFEKRGKGDGFS